jgi:hypothetical protein
LLGGFLERSNYGSDFSRFFDCWFGRGNFFDDFNWGDLSIRINFPVVKYLGCF